MDEDVKKEFEKIREEIQNQYQDAIGALSDELAEFKTEMSANLAEMGKMLGDRAKFQDDNIKSHLNDTGDVVQGIEKNIAQGNEIISEESGKMEKRLIARLDKLESVVFPKKKDDLDQRALDA